MPQGLGVQGGRLTRLHFNKTLFAQPFSHLICSCCCCYSPNHANNVYAGLARSLINTALIIVSTMISIQGFVICETHQNVSVLLGHTTEDLLLGKLSTSLLASRKHHNLDINDSMSKVIECLSHFLADAIQSCW